MARAHQHDYSSWIVVATTIFLCWTSIFAGIRTWAKLRRSMAWALYDSVFASAFILAIFQCVAIYSSVHYGLGEPPTRAMGSKELRAEKAMYAAQILYIVSVGVSKLSTILFLGTLTRDNLQKRICHGITVLVACWLVASVFAIALRHNLSMPWLGLYDGLFERWLGIESAGLGIEILLWCASIILCWGLNMPLSKRVKVVGIFGFRMFLIPLVIGRLYFLHQVQSLSDVQAVTIAQILTQAAMQYSIMAECTTCFKPFLHPFHTTYGWSSTAEHGDGRLATISTNPKRDPYVSTTSTSRGSHKVTEIKVPARAKSKRQGARVGTDEEQGMRLRPDNVSYSTNIGRNSALSRRMSADDDIELLSSRHGNGAGSGSGGIHQTTTVSVNHDEVLPTVGTMGR